MDVNKEAQAPAKEARWEKISLTLVMVLLMMTVFLAIGILVLAVKYYELADKMAANDATPVSTEVLPTEWMNQVDSFMESEESRFQTYMVSSGDAQDADSSGDEVRRVYLTFDDGPSSNTNDILDILAAYDVKATFFVVGKEGDWAEDAYKRIVEEGHTIALHSYTHDYDLIYASPEAFVEDMMLLRNYIRDLTGAESNYIRFPGGSSNKLGETDIRVLIDTAHAQGWEYYDWNASAQDATSKPLTAEEIVENCIGSMGKRKNVIILLHDGKSRDTTVAALPMLLERLQSMENVEILPLDEDTVPVQHIKPLTEEEENKNKE